MSTRYLQLRVHKLQCVRETQNRQNFMGIPLETDPDSIDISAIITDPGAGLVAQAPTVFLGNKYRDGKTEVFRSPKVIAEIPFAEDDAYPRQVGVTINMAEKDDGAGFDELMNGVARELASELSDAVGDELPDDISSHELYDKAEDVARDVISALFHEIGKALGLGDDPFRPVDVSIRLNSATETIDSRQRTVRFHEPNPKHKGEFVLTYDWYASSTRALEPARASGDVGTSSEALTRAGGGARSYPRPYNSFRFRRPMTAQKPVKVMRPIDIMFRNRPLRWWPRPIRFMTQPRPR